MVVLYAIQQMIGIHHEGSPTLDTSKAFSGKFDSSSGRKVDGISLKPCLKQNKE